MGNNKSMNVESSILIDGDVIQISANNKVDTYSGKGAATAFFIENGDVGDDIITDFGATDSLVTGKEIFDGNNDSLIAFGKNGLLDIDRVSARKAGNDQLKITDNGTSVKELRHMGEFEGQHAYALASTWHNFKSIEKNGSEGFMSDDHMTLTNSPLLIDNALGLRTGHDVVEGAGVGAKFVTTALLRDDNNDGLIQGVHNGNNFTFEVNSVNGGTLGDVTLVNVHTSYLQLVATTEVDHQTFYTYQSIEP